MTDTLLELRRRAPLHFWAKAENARFVAATLWNSKGGLRPSGAARPEYCGDPAIALNEAFLREASIALELIIKAVIAQQIEYGPDEVRSNIVKYTHAITDLWREAELPKLTRESLYRLMLAQRILFWAGRYAAPKTDAAYAEEQNKLDGIVARNGSGPLGVSRRITLDWQGFDELFLLAATTFHSMRERHG